MDAESLVTALLRLQLVASAAILVVLVLRPLALRWCGAGTAYWLWLVVPLAAMAVLLPAREQVLVIPAALDIPILQQSVEPALGVDVTREHAATAPAVQPGIPDDGSRAGLLIALWLLGAGVFLIRSVVITRRLSSGSLIGPALVGVLRPRLVLPHDFEARFSAEERVLILAHEEMHRVSRHTLVNALVEVARCASWFNPLLHWAAMRFRADQELACDTAVIAAYPDARRTYAEALLKAQLVGVYLPMGCAWTSGTAGRLAERIARLSDQLPGRRRRLAGAASIVGIGIAASYAAWAQQPARIVTVQQPNPESAAVAATETPALEAPEAVRAPAARMPDVSRSSASQAPVRTPTAQAPWGAETTADENRLRMLAWMLGLVDAKGVVDESAMQLMKGGDFRKVAQAALENKRQTYKDPERRNSFRVQARIRIKRDNRGLAQELGLSENEAEGLFDLLADSQVVRAAEGSAFLGGLFDEQERQEALRTRQEFDRMEDESIKALLGDKYAQWQAYQRTRSAGTYANALVTYVSAQLAEAGKPLTAAQSRALTTAFALATDAVVDDRAGSATFGTPVCRITRDGVPVLDNTGRPLSDPAGLAAVAARCRPLSLFGTIFATPGVRAVRSSRQPGGASTNDASELRRALELMAPHVNADQLAALREPMEQLGFSIGQAF